MQKRHKNEIQTALNFFKQYKLSLKELDRIKAIWIRLEDSKSMILRETPGAALAIPQSGSIISNELLQEQSDLNFDTSLDFIEGLQLKQSL